MVSAMTTTFGVERKGWVGVISAARVTPQPASLGLLQLAASFRRDIINNATLPSELSPLSGKGLGSPYIRAGL